MPASCRADKVAGRSTRHVYAAGSLIYDEANSNACSPLNIADRRSRVAVCVEAVLCNVFAAAADDNVLRMCIAYSL